MFLCWRDFPAFRWRIFLLRSVLVFGLGFACHVQAQTHVYLLRGWFGVFSTGMDEVAEQLRAKGIRAEAIGHLSWRSATSRLVKEHRTGVTTRIVLVGHSQGANNIIDMARELQKQDVPVDLLITLAPFLQDPVPTNVQRALNYYQSPGWGTPLTADPGFTGELANIDVGDPLTTFHVTIDKTAKIQAEIVRQISPVAP